MDFHFTFQNIEFQYKKALENNYKFITCEEYVNIKKDYLLRNKVIINRVDIDYSILKAKELADVYDRLGIRASFFIRLHAPEYNPFSFENYRIIKSLINSGHEIGYHSEIIDQSVIWNEDALDNLNRDIEIINKMFEIEIKGVASHGGMTGLNNLDFWKNKKAKEFGLLYEAYDWFNEVFYLSDSEWTRWKCYDKGKLIEGDRQSLGEHIKNNHNLIYLLVHPDTYYKTHFYE